MPTEHNQEWAGRDLNPRPPPCQGGILTKLDHRPFVNRQHLRHCASKPYTVDEKPYTVFRYSHNRGHNINYTFDNKIRFFLGHLSPTLRYV